MASDPTQGPRRPPNADRLRDAATTLMLDAETTRIVGTLGDEGIRSILLKGPSIAAWLYEDGAPRPYTDIDVLVSPRDAGAVRRILGRLGYSEYPIRSVSGHAQVWELTTTGVSVDLHRSLVGIGCGDEVFWDVFSGDAEEMAIADRAVEVLGLPARALSVVLHAAQHGHMLAHPIDDLERLLQRSTEEDWQAVAALAAQVEAEPALAAGLRLVPEGASLATRLGLSTRMPVETALRAATAPDLSIGLERLATMEGLRARAAFVARKTFPTAAYMRAWSPLAARGSTGLALAYLARPLWLLRRLGPAMKAWRQARRGQRP